MSPEALPLDAPPTTKRHPHLRDPDEERLMTQKQRSRGFQRVVVLNKIGADENNPLNTFQLSSSGKWGKTVLNRIGRGIRRRVATWTEDVRTLERYGIGALTPRS